MRHARLVLLVVTLVVSIADSAHAACAWIVWTQLGAEKWERFEIFDKRDACVRLIDRTEKGTEQLLTAS